MDKKPGCLRSLAAFLREVVLPMGAITLVTMVALNIAVLFLLMEHPESTGFVSRLTHYDLITPDEEMRWEGEITTLPNDKTFTVIYQKTQYDDSEDWYSAVDIKYAGVRIIDDDGNGTVSRVKIWFHNECLYLRPSNSEQWQRFQYLYELTVLTMKAEQGLVEEPPTLASPPAPPKAKVKAKTEPPGDDPWAAFRD